MRSTLTQYAFLLLSTHMATAQNTRSLIIPTAGTASFPACAVACAVLQQAQTICQPQAATQIAFENCFCQSPTISALYSTPDAICAAECPTPSDRALLQTWYTTFCQQVGQGIDPLTVAPTTSTTLVTVTSTSAAFTGTDTSIAGSGSNQSASSASDKSWISGHWQWVLMLGILAVGFGFIAWGAVWLKKRHRRKVDTQRARASGFPTETEKRDGARSATPDLWGPHQHMHATKGWEYIQEQAGASPSPGGDLDNHERRRSRREMGPRSEALRNSAMSDGNSRPMFSRQKSSKGKQKEDMSIQEGEPSRRGSRSRSHRRRERDKG